MIKNPKYAASLFDWMVMHCRNSSRLPDGNLLLTQMHGHVEISVSVSCDSDGQFSVHCVANESHDPAEPLVVGSTKIYAGLTGEVRMDSLIIMEALIDILLIEGFFEGTADADGEAVS